MKKFLVLVLTLVLALAACTTVLGEGYRIGFSDIYLTPSWMQQMKEMLDERTAYWQEKGVIEEVYLANANGDKLQADFRHSEHGGGRLRCHHRHRGFRDGAEQRH